MNATIQALPASAANTKPLWAAIGVLGFAVLAMGASLVYVQTRALDGHAALAALATAADTEPFGSKVPVAESLKTQEDLVEPAARPPVAVQMPKPAKPQPKLQSAAAAAPPVAAAASPSPAPTSQPAPAPVPGVMATGPATGGQATDTAAPSVLSDAGLVVSQSPPPKPICANCGTVETVTAVQKKGSGGVVGAVAGGAIGAMIGNQIGKGSGRTMATILGAVGGGVAGNMIEKNVKKESAYRVQVRMDDGSLRTVEQGTLPPVGSKVTVEGGVLHSADGGWSTPAPVKPGRQAQTAPAYERL